MGLAGLAGAVALAAGAPAAGTAPPAVSRAAGAGVCGGLTADGAFGREVGLVGHAHACEHLRLRLTAGSSARGHHARAGAAVPTAAAARRSASVVGRWSAARNPGTQAVGIAAVLLHTGKVLLVGQRSPLDLDTLAYLYDPRTGTGRDVQAPGPIFCGSLTPLADGRILSFGGAAPSPRGIQDVYIFDPVTETWSQEPDMELARYYPTSTRLPDGRVLITAGTQADGVTRNPLVEVYTPAAGAAETGTLETVGPEHATSFYPHQHVMPNGRVWQVERRTAWQLNPATWTWTQLPSPVHPVRAGSAHLALPAGPRGSNRLVVVGGRTGGRVNSSAVQHFAFAGANSAWTGVGLLPAPRGQMNLVQVADGSAYAIGGNGQGLRDMPRRRTLHFNPRTGDWRAMAAQAPRRAYHSTAVLLPDGRIMSAGDNGVGGGMRRLDFYSPPYLFQGRRPVIASTPRQLSYGQRFRIVTRGAPARRAVLLAPSATTHANEMNARHVRLASTRTRRGLAVRVPNANVAPPGYYMLVVVTRTGVPSVARWVHVAG
jgi:N-acetylneuraminic acid mutarotase